MRRVGRNDPCPCGSGKKFKRCCLEAADALVPDRWAGWMLLGGGRYIRSADPRSWPEDPVLFQMENRAAIAGTLEEAGDVGGALSCLEENVKCAEMRGDEDALWMALFELQTFCMNHSEYAELGLRVTERLLQLTDDEMHGGPAQVRPGGVPGGSGPHDGGRRGVPVRILRPPRSAFCAVALRTFPVRAREGSRGRGSAGFAAWPGWGCGCGDQGGGAGSPGRHTEWCHQAVRHVSSARARRRCEWASGRAPRWCRGVAFAQAGASAHGREAG